MPYSLIIDPRAIEDVQQAIDYYEAQEPGLGVKFERSLNEQLLRLQEHPFFQVRYDDVRCLPLSSYPYMVHFTVDEFKELIIIRGVFNTARDPTIWQQRT